MRIFNLTFIALLLLGRLIAADLHVGSGQTYSTISAAETAASASDTIIVHSGTYSEDLTIDVANLTIINNAGDSPTLSGRIDANADGITIDGLIVTGWAEGFHAIDFTNVDQGTVQNCTIHTPAVSSGSMSGVYIRNGNRMLVDNNEIYATRKGVNVAAGHSSDSTYANGIIISNNDIHDNAADGIDIHGEYFTINGNDIYDNLDTNYIAVHPDGIQFIRSDVDGYSNVSFARVYSNVIRNHTQNIFLEGWGDTDPVDEVHIWNNVCYFESGTVNGVDMDTFGGANIVLKGVDDVYVYNNYIGRTDGVMLRVQTATSQKAGSVHIKNNIFEQTNSGGGVFIFDDDDGAIADNELDYNVYDGSATNKFNFGGTSYTSLSAMVAARNYGANSTEADPLVNALPSPSLQAGSPAIDSGDSSIGALYNTDIDGVSRSGTWDIGAYEFSVGTATLTRSASSGIGLLQ